MSPPPTPRFTLSQLEYFVTTLERGSFTAAAGELGVSQPAVAEQIQRLERAVGQSLFARQARGATPTNAGRELEPHARRVLDAARQAAAQMSTTGATAGVTAAIGTFGDPGYHDVAELVREFFAQHPGGRLRIEGNNSSNTADAVRSGALDAAVVVLPVDESGLDVRPIYEGDVYYVSVDPARAAKPVGTAELCERPFIVYEASAGTDDPTRRMFADRVQAAGLRMQPLLEIELAQTALELAAEGVGDTYVSQALAGSIDPRLVLTQFDPPLTEVFALVTRTGARLSPPVQDVVDRMIQHLHDRIDRAAAR